MSNLKGFNTEGLLTDIYEDEGYEHWDLIVTVVETLCTDVNKAIQEDDKDYVYALINLLNSCDPDNLFRFLPKEGTPYDPDSCKGLGEYRLTDENFIDPDTSITVSEFLEEVIKPPKPEGIPLSEGTAMWLSMHHFPCDYEIPLLVEEALAMARMWADVDTDKSVYKQAAQTYLIHVPDAILEGHEMGRGNTPIQRIESGLKTQILYILSNLQGWRGDDARKYKKVLKAFATTNATSGDPLDY